MTLPSDINILNGLIKFLSILSQCLVVEMLRAGCGQGVDNQVLSVSDRAYLQNRKWKT